MSLHTIASAGVERRENRARLKLMGTVANTYGFAALGGALAEPLLKAAEFTVWHGVFFVVGLCAHGVALILAPKGEANVST